LSRTILPLILFTSLLSNGCSDEDGNNGSSAEAGGLCGPANCAGCCQGNQCLKGDDNGACGTTGFPCVQCQQGEVCAQGQCITASGKCNPQNCATGCCQGDSCLPGDQKDSCGKGGQPCVACAASQKCEDQSCGCSADDCKGCCEGGICRSGLVDEACGKGGQPCQECGPGTACVLSECVSQSCNATNCNGCCSGAACKPGTDVTDCGQGGETCKACKAGETCSQATCVNASQCGPGSCNGCCMGSQCLSGQSASACGSGGQPCQSCSSGQICSSGACQLDPSSSWGIVITKADIDSSKSWDTLVYTEPDPYVTVTVGSTSGSTSVINNTYTPQWDEYLFSVPASEILKNGLSVEVYDDDVVTADQLMGACSVTVPESVLLAGGGVAKDCGTAGDVKELHFQFTN